MDDAAYQAWLKSNSLTETPDYDYRGAFEAGLKPDPETHHLDDTFKKPNHITYSNDSRYAREKGAPAAGKWVAGEDGKWTFYASPTNVANAGGIDALRDYFRRNEKDVTLVLPEAKAKGGFAVKPIWDKKRPKDLGKPKGLSDKKKAFAVRRAKAAGRPYPNLVDNIAAARKKKGK